MNKRSIQETEALYTVSINDSLDVMAAQHATTRESLTNPDTFLNYVKRHEFALDGVGLVALMSEAVTSSTSKSNVFNRAIQANGIFTSLDRDGHLLVHSNIFVSSVDFDAQPIFPVPETTDALEAEVFGDMEPLRFDFPVSSLTLAALAYQTRINSGKPQQDIIADGLVAYHHFSDIARIEGERTSVVDAATGQLQEFTLTD